jgi:hypothetical protein
MFEFCCFATYIDAVQQCSSMGGIERKKVMREIHRPIHSSYETLRLRRDPQRREAQFNRKAFPANEQLTALGYTQSRRPQSLFEHGYSR